jgi:heterodisulfide reductase subunit B
MHQIRAEKRFDAKTNVKIIYFTQLLGLALGLKPRKVGLHENISDSLGLLKARGLA